MFKLKPLVAACTLTAAGLLGAAAPAQAQI